MITRLVAALRQIIVDGAAVLRLRWVVTRRKAARYDALAQQVVGLRRALQTQQRARDKLREDLQSHMAQIDHLRAEYASLQARQQAQQAATIHDERLRLFRELRPLLTQLPTLRAAVEQGADVAAADVLHHVSSLHTLFADMGFEVIGEVGGELPYDARQHRAVGRGARAVAPGDHVQVRYIGYAYEGEVVCKAEVTRLESES